LDRYKRWGVYSTEIDDYEWAREIVPHDTDRKDVEAEIMDWADDVAYAVHDVEDFYRAGLIPLERFIEDEPEVDHFAKHAEQKLKDEFELDQDAKAILVRVTESSPAERPYVGDPLQRAGLTLSAAKGGPTFTIPKSAKCRRRVTLTEGAVDALQRHHHKQLQEKTMVGTEWQDNGLVFCSIVGTPMSRNNLHNRSFKPLLGRAGLPHIRCHDLRHTCGTIMGSMGVDPKYAQDRLGHADISLTLNTYTHVLPEVRAEVAGKIEGPFTA